MLPLKVVSKRVKKIPKVQDSALTKFKKIIMKNLVCCCIYFHDRFEKKEGAKTKYIKYLLNICHISFGFTRSIFLFRLGDFLAKQQCHVASFEKTL
jgi:hypothetical protein